MNENQGLLSLSLSLSLFLSLSLSRHGIRAKEENLIISSFPVSSILGNFPVIVFHFGHLSHLPNLSGQSDHRQKTLIAGNFSGEFFPATSGDVFFRHRPYHKERLEEISNFCQSIGTRNSTTRRPCAVFRPTTESHAPARKALFGEALPLPASLDID